MEVWLNLLNGYLLHKKTQQKITGVNKNKQREKAIHDRLLRKIVVKQGWEHHAQSEHVEYQYKPYECKDKIGTKTALKVM